jgi:SpoU rRNA methylase family enzyme
MLDEEIKPGSNIIVCDDLKTKVEYIEGEKIYFYDENGKLKYEFIEAIKTNPTTPFINGLYCGGCENECEHEELSNMTRKCFECGNIAIYYYNHWI